ncbi:hypothetical protein F4809DRAFT_620671 [Biscogniauxia mediterranea]|nr:hypothetical protein F4809DRAFT_620671 [Biscogniauxia mediterranea]
MNAGEIPFVHLFIYSFIHYFFHPSIFPPFSPPIPNQGKETCHSAVLPHLACCCSAVRSCCSLVLSIA